jgi:hypothetical protein
MKRAARVAWSVMATTMLAVLFLFITVSTARAPHGGKNSLGGRTIASIQEEEFDRRILRYQLCYGVRLYSEKATQERRRVCKAMLVHRLEAVLEKAGAYFRVPMEFQCDDTAFSRRDPAQSRDIVALKPNAEFLAIDRALSAHLEQAEASEREDHIAREACSFLTDCKLAMRPNHLSLRKLASCLSTPDMSHRKILLDEIGAMLFHAKNGRTKLLYSELLQEARK